jgi:hypothetical protein
MLCDTVAAMSAPRLPPIRQQPLDAVSALRVRNHQGCIPGTTGSLDLKLQSVVRDKAILWGTVRDRAHRTTTSLALLLTHITGRNDNVNRIRIVTQGQLLAACLYILQW